MQQIAICAIYIEPNSSERDRIEFNVPEWGKFYIEITHIRYQFDTKCWNFQSPKRKCPESKYFQIFVFRDVAPFIYFHFENRWQELIALALIWVTVVCSQGEK